MAEMPQVRRMATGDFSLLAYAQHMAETARSETAKHLFESFVEQERRWLSANGVHQLHKSGAQEPAAADRTPCMPVDRRPGAKTQMKVVVEKQTISVPNDQGSQNSFMAV